MHPSLRVDEILKLVAHEIVAANQNATAVALARCCKCFEDPVLDALWETMFQFTNLLKTLPGEIWGPGGYQVSIEITMIVFPIFNPSILKSFRRLLTVQEWARFRTYARRMRKIEGHGTLDLLSSQVLSALQLHTLNELLLPNLQSLWLWFTNLTEDFISFIPLFLSTKTTLIDIIFSGSDLHIAAIASMITAFPKLCPNLYWIRFGGLPRDSMITDAVSELVLRTGRNALQYFSVDLPLTAEALEVICKHPDLSTLSTSFDWHTTLPTMALPNLTDMDIDGCYDHDWLQGFCGASLGKLTSVSISSHSDSTDEFLGAFKTVALTTSIPTTLSSLRYNTECSWKPDYRPLLPFTQLRDLVISSTCDIECSSTIDDNTITDLAQAMPQLEFLRLGNSPCETPAGVTAKGLTALAYHCPHLFNLCIHFQVASLDPAVIPNLTPSDESTITRGGCALCSLQVGRIRVPEESTSMVASALVQIFPDLKEIECFDMGWEKVSLAMDHYRQLALVRNVYLPYLAVSLMMSPSLIGVIT